MAFCFRQVPHRGFDRFVPHQLLYGLQIHSRLQEFCAVRRTELVWVIFGPLFLHDLLDLFARASRPDIGRFAFDLLMRHLTGD
jgi:hypothetical protein